MADVDEVAVEDDGVVAVGQLAPAEVLSAFEAVLEVEGVFGVGVEKEEAGAMAGHFHFSHGVQVVLRPLLFDYGIGVDLHS